MTIELQGTLTAADVPGRRLTYRLLPYGEVGRTSVGAVIASAGALTLPAAPSDLVLNVQHDRNRPAARCSLLAEDATGLTAAFDVLPTREGDDLLAEADARVRVGVSVEVDDPVIRDGHLIAGRLSGAGAVVEPAFPSALLVAADTEPAPDEDEDDPDEPAGDEPAGDEPAPEPAPETPAGDPADPDSTNAGTPPADTEDDTVTETLTAAAPAALPGTVAAPALTRDRVIELLTAARAGDRSPQLLAALSDITLSTNPVLAPQWIGEVWAGNTYDRQIVPLIGGDDLTSASVTGWKWSDLPTGADYTGNKTDVPSDTADTAAVTYTALRWAGAHDVDRALRDFPNEGFWASYWAAMAASYSRWSDSKAAAGLVAGATAVTPDGTGVVAAIVKAALQVIPYATPTFALLGASAFAELVERDPLAFLSGQVSLANGDGNVGGITFRASADVATDQVVVGSRNAATWYELGGGAPIRVETVDMVKGGIDVGAFGYGVVGVHDGRAIAKATIVPPTP